MARQRIRKRPMADINVVPYIDVMLVMLVIFMITAPLLTQGVQVDLPVAAAEPVDESDKEPLDGETLAQNVAAVLRRQPQKSVLVRGDRAVDYGTVVSAMVLLQQAGVPSVGLVTEPPEQ